MEINDWLECDIMLGNNLIIELVRSQYSGNIGWGS